LQRKLKRVKIGNTSAPIIICTYNLLKQKEAAKDGNKDEK